MKSSPNVLVAATLVFMSQALLPGWTHGADASPWRASIDNFDGSDAAAEITAGPLSLGIQGFGPDKTHSPMAALISVGAVAETGVFTNRPNRLSRSIDQQLTDGNSLTLRRPAARRAAAILSANPRPSSDAAISTMPIVPTLASVGLNCRGSACGQNLSGAAFAMAGKQFAFDFAVPIDMKNPDFINVKATGQGTGRSEMGSDVERYFRNASDGAALVTGSPLTASSTATGQTVPGPRPRRR